MRRVIVLLVLLAACGSTDAGLPSPEPLPPDTEARWVLGAADEVAFRRVVSGGIAGFVFSDVLIKGDGSGTVLDANGETVEILVDLESLNEFLLDLEAAGVFDLDPDDHPNVSLADGVGSGVTVRTVNGLAEFGVYGITEEPDLFDDTWHRVFEALGGVSRVLDS